MGFKKTRWSSGICQKCQEHFDMITFVHAYKHGFTHPNDMAKTADFIIWDGFCNEKKRRDISGDDIEYIEEMETRPMDKGCKLSAGVDKPLHGDKVG